MQRMLTVLKNPTVSLVGANLVKIGFVLIINKIAALILKPADFGILSQFFNTFAIANMVSSAGIGNATIRDIATTGNQDEGYRLARQYRRIPLIFSFVVGLLLILFSSPLSRVLFSNSEFAYLIIIIGMLIPFLGLTNFLNFVNLGLQRQWTNAVSQVAGFSLGMLVFGVVIWVSRDLFGISLGYALFMIAPVVFLMRQTRLSNVTGEPASGSGPGFRHLLGDSSAMFISFTLVPVALLLMRSDLGSRYSWHDVSLWQVCSRISDVYMQVFAIYFSGVFLGKLAASHDKAVVVRKALINNLLAFIPVAGVVIFLAPHLIRILFSGDYVDAASYMPWQISYDLGKVILMILMYYFTSRRLFKWYITLEVIQAILILLLPRMFIFSDGVFAALVCLTITQWTALAIGASFYFISQKESHK